MIDLDDAARKLTASVAHVTPDLARVRVAARRRQHRRRTVLAAAVVAVLAGGTAAALAVGSGGSDGIEDVHTTPSPKEAAPFVDAGLLRLAIPDGWTVEDTSAGGCGGPKVIVIGDVWERIHCSEPTGLRILPMDPNANPATDKSRNGIPIQGPIVAGVGSGSSVHLPTLLTTLEFAEGVDPEPFLASIAPSAQQVALADVRSGAQPAWQRDPGDWQTVTFDGVSVRVPASWPTSDRDDPRVRAGDPCAAWGREGPSAATGRGASRDCEPTRAGQPIDGVWLLPQAGTTSETRSGTQPPEQIDGTPVRIYPTSGGVVEVAVPEAGVLVRIGLGVDGHTAAAILASITRDD